MKGWARAGRGGPGRDNVGRGGIRIDVAGRGGTGRAGVGRCEIGRDVAGRGGLGRAEEFGWFMLLKVRKEFYTKMKTLIFLGSYVLS